MSPVGYPERLRPRRAGARGRSSGPAELHAGQSPWPRRCPAANGLASVPLAMLLALAASSVSSAAADPPPALPFIDRDLCPLEQGCNFREDWVAEHPLTVYAAEGDTEHLLFRIAARERFRPLRADMYLTRPGVVLVTASRDAGCEPPDCWEPGFERGDIVYVLSYRGAGSYLVAHRGRLRVVEGFWNEDPPRRGILREAPVMHWWVLVRNGAGREGWLRLRATASFGISREEIHVP